MKHMAVLPLLLALISGLPGPAGLLSQEGGRAEEPGRIVAGDIDRFWKAYDAAAVAPTYEDTLRAFFENYYVPGSPGLKDFIRTRIGSVIQLVDALHNYPNYYASIREQTLRVHEFVPEIRSVLTRFSELYPEMQAPDVYFLIGRLTSGGTTSASRILIGTEMYGRTEVTDESELSPWLRTVLAGIDNVPTIVAHELIHTQQRFPRNSTGTLLAKAIQEGSCDFLGELISGRNINDHVHAWADPREAQLWGDFQDVMLGSETTGWLYGNRAPEEPNDLGYWIGYMITAAYYARAVDKRQAIHDILHIQDFEAFLAASGFGERQP